MQNSDNVHQPSHYIKGGLECMEAIKTAVCNLNGFEAYATGNAIKYLWRWKDKNGVEDLRKAKEYIDRLIEATEKRNR